MIYKPIRKCLNELFRSLGFTKDRGSDTYSKQIVAGARLFLDAQLMVRGDGGFFGIARGVRVALAGDDYVVLTREVVFMNEDAWFDFLKSNTDVAVAAARTALEAQVIPFFEPGEARQRLAYSASAELNSRRLPDPDRLRVEAVLSRLYGDDQDVPT